MNKAFIFLLTTFLLTSLASASTFGYNYLDNRDYVIKGANYSINVNNTEYLDGYSVSTLYTYYRGLLQTYFNGVYCQLTGCTMAGDINMNGNDINMGNGNITEANCIELSGNTYCNFETTYYNATSGTAITGTTAGSINLTQHPDGNYDEVTFNITEQSGGPGLDLRVNFTGDITTFNKGYLRYYTSTLQGDYPIIQLWDYCDNEWEGGYGEVIEATLDFFTIAGDVLDSSCHVQDGIVQMRLYKSANGNNNNKYYIDMLAIVDGYATPSGNVELSNYWRKGNTEEFGNYYTSGNITTTGIGTFNQLNASLTNGSVLFYDGSKISQDNSKLFWDNVNKRLGIGITTPIVQIQAVSSGTSKIEATSTGNENAEINMQNTAGYWAQGVLATSGNWRLRDINNSRNVFTIEKGARVNDLYLKSGGGVGINTGSPRSTLDVNGNIWTNQLQIDHEILGGLILDTSSGRGYWAPYTGSAYDFSQEFGFDGNNNYWYSEKSIILAKDSGNVGIGTNAPTNGKLEVSGSTSGISIYASNNISAEDYLYHSPFPSDDYTDSQALNDLLKVDGNNGKINHSTVPNNALSVIEKPIYEYEIKNSEEEECVYSERLFSDEYTKECFIKTEEVIKQSCKNVTIEEYREIDGKSDTFEEIEIQTEECENIIISHESEPQTSIGMMIGNIIKSIKELNRLNTNQDAEIQMLKTELCKKDSSYKWCLGEIR